MPKAERKTKNMSDSSSSNVIQDLNDIIGDFGGESTSQEEKELLELEKLADEPEQAVLNIPQPLSADEPHNDWLVEFDIIRLKRTRGQICPWTEMW